MKRHSGRTYVTGQISSLLPVGLCGQLCQESVCYWEHIQPSHWLDLELQQPHMKLELAPEAHQMVFSGKNPVKLSWMFSGEFIVSGCCTLEKCINKSEMSIKRNKSWQDSLPDSVFMIFNSYSQEKRIVSLKSFPLKKMSACRHYRSYKHQYPP